MESGQEQNTSLWEEFRQQLARKLPSQSLPIGPAVQMITPAGTMPAGDRVEPFDLAHGSSMLDVFTTRRGNAAEGCRTPLSVVFGALRQIAEGNDADKALVPVEDG
jgi:hypothetical protein